MKDITPADAERLAQCCCPVPDEADFEGEFLGDASSYAELLKKGYLREEQSPTGQWFYQTTERGRIALACHEVNKK